MLSYIVSLSPRERSRKRAKLMKELVEELDAIRALKLFNTSRSLRYIYDLKLEGELWKNVTEVLKKISLIPTQAENFSKIKRIDTLADIIFMGSFAGMVGALVLLLLNLEPILSYFILLFTLIILNISYIMKFYVSVKLRSIYLSRSEELKTYNELFRKAVDNIVSRLRGELKKAGLDPREVEFKLYHGDYTGLIIIEEKKGVYKLKIK